jgi:hypothetical protein
MNQNPDHTPPKRQPLLPPFAEPGITPSAFFMPSSPPRTEVLPYQQTPLTRESPWPPPPPQAGPVINRSANPVAPQQSPRGQTVAAANRARLQRLCRHLRETDSCPGECVLSRARQNRRLHRSPRMR